MLKQAMHRLPVQPEGLNGRNDPNDPRRGTHQALRRPRPPRGRVLARQEEGPHRPLRPQRLGQDDAAAHAGGHSRSPTRARSAWPRTPPSATCPRTASSTRAGRCTTRSSLAFEELLALKEEQHRIEDQLAQATDDDGGEHERLLERYAEVTERFKHLGGYEIDARVADVLKGLGFSLEDQQRQTEEFSGGWQMRIALAKLLLARPNLLLMDEPTNHLDLPARNWLEEYLSDYPGSVVLVSHDRYFLDSTVKRITEVGLRTLTDYHGNYSKYVVEHEARMERLLEAHRRQTEEIEKTEAFINRFRYQATKARQVQSRIKQLDKVERIEIPAAAQEDPLQVPRRAQAGPGGPGAQGRPQGLRRQRRARRRGPHGRARRPHRPRGPERRGQVDPDAHPGRRRPARRRARALEGHQVVIDYFAQDQAAVLNPTRHRLRGDVVARAPPPWCR